MNYRTNVKNAILKSSNWHGKFKNDFLVAQQAQRCRAAKLPQRGILPAVGRSRS